MSDKRKVHTLTTIAVDGTVKSEQLPDTLDNISERVGGYIEHVPAWATYEGKRCTVYCNENGIAERLPFNQKATALWIEYLEHYKKTKGVDYDRGMVHLLGPVVIVTRAEEKA